MASAADVGEGRRLEFTLSCYTYPHSDKLFAGLVGRYYCQARWSVIHRPWKSSAVRLSLHFSYARLSFLCLPREWQNLLGNSSFFTSFRWAVWFSLRS